MKNNSKINKRINFENNSNSINKCMISTKKIKIQFNNNKKAKILINNSNLWKKKKIKI